jgi:hypothetical protein
MSIFPMSGPKILEICQISSVGFWRVRVLPYVVGVHLSLLAGEEQTWRLTERCGDHCNLHGHTNPTKSAQKLLCNSR